MNPDFLRDPARHIPAITIPQPVPISVLNPQHYRFSNGAEVIDITENLTGNGAQAVHYIARSTRADGLNKGDVIEDLEKAAWFIERELKRAKAKA